MTLFTICNLKKYLFILLIKMIFKFIYSSLIGLGAITWTNHYMIAL